MNLSASKYIPIKKILAIATLTAAIAIISGCATSANFKKMINSWNGESAQELVDQFGYPNNVIIAPDGHQVYQYNHTDVGYFHSAGCNNGTCLPSLYVKDCTVWFKLSTTNIITELKYRGSGCIYGSSEEDFAK